VLPEAGGAVKKHQGSRKHSGGAKHGHAKNARRVHAVGKQQKHAKPAPPKKGG